MCMLFDDMWAPTLIYSIHLLYTQKDLLIFFVNILDLDYFCYHFLFARGSSINIFRIIYSYPYQISGFKVLFVWNLTSEHFIFNFFDCLL